MLRGALAGRPRPLGEAPRRARADRCPAAARVPSPAVRQLLPPTDPPAAEVDPVELAWNADRPAPLGRPWVLVNMVSSTDGAASVAGRSGALGGPADRAMFQALREVPDVILVAAGTVRAEGYRPPDPGADQRARRAEHGRDPVPRLAVVSRSLDLDLDAPLFTQARARPIVLTGSRAPADRRADAAQVAEVVEAGEHGVEPDRALAALGRLGVEVVLCEGGPSLLGQLVDADLVDELCLSLSPALVGGDSGRIAHGPAPGELHALRLERVVEADGLLLLRYRRARGTTEG